MQVLLPAEEAGGTVQSLLIQVQGAACFVPIVHSPSGETLFALRSMSRSLSFIKLSA